jgi:hypothetical protein
MWIHPLTTCYTTASVVQNAELRIVPFRKEMVLIYVYVTPGLILFLYVTFSCTAVEKLTPLS